MEAFKKFERKIMQKIFLKQIKKIPKLNMF